MAVKLIVNADDFGLSEGVCLGTIEAHRDGIVTSCSLMINVADRNDFILLNNEPDLGVGIHLNLTRGPAMASGNLGSLVDADGNFIIEHRDGFEGVDEEHIRKELRAQVEAALNSGVRNIDHLDTHHHIQRHRVVFDAIKALAVEKGFACRASDPWMVDELREAGVWCNDFFIEEFFGRGNIGADKLVDIINNLKDGVTEIMCHPGYLTGEFRLASGYTQERLIELKTLIDPRVIDAINAKGVELMRFGG